MPEWLENAKAWWAANPGVLFVVATLLPVVSVLILLLGGGLRNYLRRWQGQQNLGAGLFQVLGGDVAGRVPAWIATAAIGLAFVCSFTGFVLFLADYHHFHEERDELTKQIEEFELAQGEARIKAKEAGNEPKQAEHVGSPGTELEFAL